MWTPEARAGRIASAVFSARPRCPAPWVSLPRRRAPRQSCRGVHLCFPLVLGMRSVESRGTGLGAAAVLGPRGRGARAGRCGLSPGLRSPLRFPQPRVAATGVEAGQTRACLDLFVCSFNICFLFTASFTATPHHGKKKNALFLGVKNSGGAICNLIDEKQRNCSRKTQMKPGKITLTDFAFSPSRV